MLLSRWRDDRGRRDHVRGRRGAGPLARPSRVLLRRRAALRRRALPGLGRPHRPARSDWETLLASVRTLAERFPPETVVYSGHGPPTTLGARARAQSVPRRAARVTKFEAPRGTHDILPSEQPLWQKVTAEMERCARSTAIAASRRRSSRTPTCSSAPPAHGSDIVPKEMYTFTDRGDRSLTLRPEATAPICAPTSSTACTASRSR